MRHEGFIFYTRGTAQEWGMRSDRNVNRPHGHDDQKAARGYYRAIAQARQEQTRSRSGMPAHSDTAENLHQAKQGPQQRIQLDHDGQPASRAQSKLQPRRAALTTARTH